MLWCLFYKEYQFQILLVNIDISF
ncbi:hypothetical protein U1Q18_052477 [Sarracenia purpurea var. burkii]